MKKHLFFLFMSLFLAIVAYGQQQEANIWIFGKKVGIDFNTTPPTALNVGLPMVTFEGCASIANANGELMFYTNGITVWNKFHEVMVNGQNLGGHNSATQSAIIVPKPNNPDIYYIFTVAYQGGPEGLQYSVVDMSAGSAGEVKVDEKNIQLVTPVTEKVTAMKADNNEDIWVITHLWEEMIIIGNDTTYVPSNEFAAYKVTENGIDTANKVISAVGSYHGGNRLNTQGYMKGSPDGQKLALGIEQSNMYELFDFNNLTGVVSNPITFPNYYAAYGLEFSPNSRILYLCEEDVTNASKMHIYQIDLFAGSPIDIVNSKTFIGTATNNALDARGALQVGPNQKIFIARMDSDDLGVINNPNLFGSECGFVNDGFSLWNGTDHVSKQGLPTFIQSYFAPPDFVYENECEGDEVQFTITSDLTGALSVFWEFGDGGTSTLENPTHVYPTAGEYVVTLTIYYETIERVAEEIITVLASPIPAFNYDPYCFQNPTQFYDDTDPVAGEVVEWEWDFGDGTANIQNPVHTFTTSGAHNVSLHVVTSNGCENTATQTVDQIPAPAAPNTPVGASEICQDSDNTQYQTSSVPGANSYYWSITPAGAGSISGAALNGTVNWSASFSGTAYVSVAAVNVCGDVGPASDPIEVTVNALPDVDAGMDQDILYETSTVIDDATVSGVEPFSYNWQPQDSLIDHEVLNPETVLLYTPNTFTLTVTDGNNCVNSDEVFIDIFGGPIGLYIEVENDSICHGDEVLLNAIAWGGSEEFSYTWWAIPDGGFSSEQPYATHTPDETTTYYCEIFDGFNYKEASITITVIPLPLVEAGPDQFLPNGVSTQLSGNVSGGAGLPYSYQWSPANLLYEPLSASPQTFMLYQSVVFELVGTDKFGCQNTDNVAITVSDDFLNVVPYAIDSCVCYGEMTSLYCLAIGGDTTSQYDYYWEPAELVVDPENASTSTNPIHDTTTFIIKVYDGYNWATDSIIITVNKLPDVNLIPDGYEPIGKDSIIACVYDTIILDAGNPGFDFLWNDGDTSQQIHVQTSGIGYDIQTRMVTVTNPETLCVEEDTLTIVFSFNECTGIFENNNNAYIHCYPNPTHGKLTVSMYKISGTSELQLYDLRGQLLRSEQLDSPVNTSEQKYEIDLSEYEPGVYLLNIVSDKAVYFSKIVVQ